MSQPQTLLQLFRCQLAHAKTSVSLCLLGIAGGICAATTIILFRLGIDWLQSIVLSSPGEYSDASALVRFAMPFVGVGLIITIAKLTGFEHYRLGIPFVIHRFKTHFGHIPYRTTINQFFGGMFALASGFVVGREGPSVHLGAASTSFLGRWLHLPHNSIKILAGCGIAAGISATFNTPLAAVIFVMEVVMREYRTHMFVPITLAAACGTIFTRLVFGSEHELAFFAHVQLDPWFYIYLIFVGVVLGALAALFNGAVMRIMRSFSQVSIVQRLLLAAFISAIAAGLLPQALGANFESLGVLFTVNPSAELIALLLGIKLIMAVTAIGLGIPGGIVGPVMLVGMLAGALLLTPLGAWLHVPDYISTFALLGLAGMLAAVLHAPLAALTAVMELSQNPEIILPVMLVIVPAYVTSTQLFKSRSIFIQQLDYLQLDYTVNPIRGELEKVGVLAIMQAEFQQFPHCSKAALTEYFSNNPNDLVVLKQNDSSKTIFRLAQYNTSLDYDGVAIDYFDMNGVNSQSSLASVYDELNKQRSGAVYIYAENVSDIIGIVTWSHVQKHLHQAHI